MLEQPKTYTGRDVENIFFRPAFCGAGAEELGIRVLYNMPVPTTVQILSRQGNMLRPFISGWEGGQKAKHQSCRIDLQKVKAEMSYTAEEYFATVFELIACRADVNMGDLTGTELEQAETELFRQSIAESVRSTMWLGDRDGDVSSFTTFDGLLKNTLSSVATDGGHLFTYDMSNPTEYDAATLLASLWDNASAELKSLRSGGSLAYFVSSDIYTGYERYLDAKGTDSAYRESIDGRERLAYHGIPVVEVSLGKYSSEQNLYHSFAILTDRRNLVLALNTADMPENEVRFWYNPDEMENRQRAVFLAGTACLDGRIVSMCHADEE